MPDLDQLAHDFQASLAELAEAAGVELSAPAEPVRAGSNGQPAGTRPAFSVPQTD
jgi:hypothetical protein